MRPFSEAAMREAGTVANASPIRVARRRPANSTLALVFLGVFVLLASGASVHAIARGTDRAEAQHDAAFHLREAILRADQQMHATIETKDPASQDALLATMDAAIGACAALERGGLVHGKRVEPLVDGAAQGDLASLCPRVFAQRELAEEIWSHVLAEAPRDPLHYEWAVRNEPNIAGGDNVADHAETILAAAQRRATVLASAATTGVALLVVAMVALSLRSQRRIGEGMEMAKASHDRFELVAGAALEAVYDWDAVRDRTWWSSGLERQYGYRPDRVATMAAWFDLVHPDDRDRVSVEHGRAIAARLPSWSGEYRLRRPDGTYADVNTRQTIFYDGPGRVVRLVGCMTDVTERKRSERSREAAASQERELDQLRALHQTRSQFINAAAHELNTPITPLLLQMDLLRSEVYGELNPKQRRAVQLLDRNLLRLSGLARDLLDVARLESGRLRLDRHATDLSAILDEAVESFAEPARRKGLDIDLHAPPNVRVPLDVARVHQVLTNLLSNAIKFTPDGGHVKVSATATADDVLVTVADTGPGLSLAQRERLFQPFSQVHEDARFGGTGLGLYISKGIVAQHGGRIGVDSDGPGRGASFWFTLPLAAATPVGGMQETPPASIEIPAPDAPPLPTERVGVLAESPNPSGFAAGDTGAMP